MNLRDYLRQLRQYILILLVIATIWIPFYWILISSLKPMEELLRANPTFFPHHFTLEHYIRLLQESIYLTYLNNSLMIAGGTTLIVVILSVLAAYSIYRLNYKGKEVIFRGILIVYVFPRVLIITSLYQLFSIYNLIDSFIGLIIVNVTFIAPFTVWLLRSFFRTIPKELEEAAYVDGANRLQAVIRVVLPLAAPGIVTAATYAFVTSWTEYLFASVFIISRVKQPLPVGLSDFIAQYRVDWGLTTSGAVLATIPGLIFFAFLGRYFIKGLTEGAVE